MADKDYLKMQLFHLIKSMEQEGRLDDTFSMIHGMKDSSSPLEMSELVQKFCTSAREVFKFLTYLLGRPAQTTQSYYEISEWALKLQGSAISFGAPRLSRICTNLRQAALNGLKEQCLDEMNGAKYEFSVLQEKLPVIVELQKKISTS